MALWVVPRSCLSTRISWSFAASKYFDNLYIRWSILGEEEGRLELEEAVTPCILRLRLDPVNELL